MDKKKTKRTKSKNQVDGNGRSSKKKFTEVTSAKEEQERLEAANILSSLKFMAPTTSDAPKTPQTPENAAKSIDNVVTYFPSTTTTGISNTSTPSLNQGRQPPVVGGSVAPLTLTPHVLAQLSQLAVMGSTAIPKQILSLLALQAKPIAKTRPSDSKVPSVVMSAEPSRLPLTLNPVKTVNRTVASALRQTVTQNTIKTTKDPALGNAVITSLNSSVVKSIKEKLQKKTAEDETNAMDSAEGPSVSSEDKTSRKKDTTDNSLPLKKRRLVSQLETQPSDIGSTRLSELTTAVQMENILNLARDYPGPSPAQGSSLTLNHTASTVSEGYRPVRFDPRTSLLVLSDLKAALTPDDDGDLPIHIAVVHENTELVKKFIDIMAMSGKSVDRYNKLQQTPLHLAVLVNKPDIVQALLGANADPNLVDRNGCTSVHLAVTKQFFLCLKKIFAVSRKRVEVNTRNYEGYSPLHTSVELGDLKAMKYLIEKGASTYINLNIQDGKAGRSVLFYATEYKRVHIVEYLISCGVNVDLQNYAGVSALMTSQAGGFDEITQLLTKALESQKLSDDGLLPKKVPIPQIPSKAKLIVSDSPLVRSRSNSLSFENKPAPVSRTSSTSSSSPMDLSLHRKIQSPSNGHGRRSKRNSIDSDFMGISVSEADKLASKNMKEKHGQIIAALEGRNLLNFHQSGVTRLFRPKGLTDQISDQVRKEMSQLIGARTVKDVYNFNNVKVKEEPPDAGEIWGQASVQSMETEAESTMILAKGIAHFHDRSKVPVNVYGQTVLPADEDNISEKSAPLLLKGESELTEMEAEEICSMPILSRAVSLTETPHDSILQGAGTEGSEGSNRSPLVGLDRVNPTLDILKQGVTRVVSSSQRSSSADKSVEISMDVDNDSNSADVDFNEDNGKEAEETTPLDSANNSVGDDSENMNDVEMDINAIEMDAEQDDDEEIQGTLVIDENVSNDSDPDKGVTIEVGLIDIDVERKDSPNPDSGKDSHETEKTRKITESQNGASCNVFKVSQPLIDLMKRRARLNHSDKAQDKQSSVFHSKGIPVLPQGTVKSPSIADQNITESVPHYENDTHCSQSDSNYNSTTVADSTIEKQNILNSVTEKRNSDTASENRAKQTEQPLNKDHVTGSDKASTKESVFPTGQSQTLYVRDGDSYKPIKIFIDDSVQSSMLLQQMMEKTLVKSGTNAGVIPLVKPDSTTGKSVSEAFLSQTTNNLSSSTSDISDHINTTTANLAKTLSVNSDRVSSSDLILEFKKRKEAVIAKQVTPFIKSAQIDKPKLDKGKAMSLGDLGSLYKKYPVGVTVPHVSVDKQQTTNYTPKRKEIRIADFTGKTSEIGSVNIDRPAVKVMEPFKASIADKASSDGLKKPAIDATTKVTHSPVKQDNTSQKPHTTTSQKPFTTTSSNPTNRKLGLSSAVPPSKVTNLLQNRAAVSTSEGTLTWVNPDIKSRLSKALQSPQRKLSAKGQSSDGETNQGACTVEGAGHSENVQAVMVPETRQKS